MTKVVVIGGGVMGASAAWRLARRGAEVVLLEQFGPRHDKGSSHGSSRIFRLAYPDRLYVDLAARAQQLWLELEAATSTRVLTLTGAVDHGPLTATAALQEALTAGGHPSELLSPAEAAARWPGLRFDTSVLFHPDAGRVHADDAVSALQQAAALAGAEVRHDARVAEVTPRGETARIALADGTVIDADAAVVAVGGWLPYLFAGAFPLPPLRVTQEQPAHFPVSAELDALTWPSFIHHGGGEIPADEGIYGTGSIDGVKIGRHAAGPAIDPDRRDRSIDQARVADLQEYARRWLPGVNPARPEPTTCLYTITPDHDFLIDRVGPLTVLGGFSGHGFKHAPAVGELAAALILDNVPAPKRFSLDRPYK
jgi:sarcosine oxidase